MRKDNLRHRYHRGMTPDDLSLDPLDWDAFRALAHRMVDDMVTSLSELRDGPAWRPMPPDAKAAVRPPLPRSGIGEAAAYELFRDRVLPYSNGNRHPRFFGWVQGNGTAMGMMADMLAAGLNPHCAGFEQSSTYVEQQVIEWLRALMGFPEGASGVLVSGGSVANIIGLTAARDTKAGFPIRDEGLHGDRPRLTFYASTQTHGWAAKAANLLGLGNASFRSIPVDAEQRISIPHLEKTIAKDRAEGMRPFCVLGTAGTVNTGAFDDLDAIADLCARQGLWFHVDGAFGAWTALSAQHAHLVSGMQRADSLAFDLHKWGYLPFECACALVRDAEAHERAFGIEGSYIEPTGRGVFAAGIPFARRGLELTRGFKALKVWLSFLAYGTDRIAALVDQNIAQAQRLRRLVDDDPSLERLAPAPLNIVCFRHVVQGRTDEELDALNREILYRVQESGFAVPSGTTIDSRFGLRACFVNHRTRMSDVDALVDRIGEIAREL